MFVNNFKYIYIIFIQNLVSIHIYLIIIYKIDIKIILFIEI